MARIAVLSIALLVIIPAVVFAQTEGSAKPADSATTAIEVKGAKCQMCADKITGAVQDLKGVHSAEVDLNAKIATVKYDPAVVTVAKLEKAIAGVGYTANNVKRDRAAYNKLCPCCK